MVGPPGMGERDTPECLLSASLTRACPQSILIRMSASARAWIYVFAVSAMSLAGCSVKENNRASPITTAPTAKEINQRGVVGVLGIPVGKIAVIGGRAVFNPKFYSGKSEDVYLSVDVVSGHGLAAPVIMRLWVPKNISEPVALPKPGDSIMVTGFERCYYNGIPFNVVQPNVQAFGFGFTSDLVVLDIQDPYIPSTQPATQADKPDPISINEIVQRGVIGTLGKRLGDGMIISGTIVDQLRVDDMSGNWEANVEVDNVDGVPLSRPVSIRVDAWVEGA